MSSFGVAGAWRAALVSGFVVWGVQCTAQARPADSARQASAQGDAAAGSQPLIDDVEQAFARIQKRGEHFTARVNGLIPKPRYRPTVSNFFGFLNHFQGIQRLPGSSHVAISGSNRSVTSAELFIVRLGEGAREEGEVVARIGLDDVMGHAGGMAIEGTILAVPLHGGVPRRAKVVFYDVGDPEHPRKQHVEIDRPGRKAGAVALTRLAGGHFLAAVLSAYDGLPRRIDFYLSRGPVLEHGFHPEPVTWPVGEVMARSGQDRTFSHFQSFGFIRQSDNRLYLVGFHNSFASPSILRGRDYADLYEVVFPKETNTARPPGLAKPSIIKAASRLLQCIDGYCNLDAAAGLFVDPATKSLSIYAAPGWLDGDIVKVTVYRSR